MDDAKGLFSHSKGSWSRLLPALVGEVRWRVDAKGIKSEGFWRIGGSEVVKPLHIVAPCFRVKHEQQRVCLLDVHARLAISLKLPYAGCHSGDSQKT